MVRMVRRFVLVGDDQVPASPRDVLAVVQAHGYKTAGERFGYSESALRKFLSGNHYVAVRQVVFEKTTLPPESTPIPDPLFKSAAREGDPVSGE